MNKKMKSFTVFVYRLLSDADDCFYSVRDGTLRPLETEANVKGKLFV